VMLASKTRVFIFENDSRALVAVQETADHVESAIGKRERGKGNRTKTTASTAPAAGSAALFWWPSEVANDDDDENSGASGKGEEHRAEGDSDEANDAPRNVVKQLAFGNADNEEVVNQITMGLNDMLEKGLAHVAKSDSTSLASLSLSQAAATTTSVTARIGDASFADTNASTDKVKKGFKRSAGDVGDGGVRRRSPRKSFVTKATGKRTPGSTLPSSSRSMVQEESDE